MPYELTEDVALAEEAVRAAAGAAAAERAAGEVAYKASAGDPVVSADRAAERADRLAAALAPAGRRRCSARRAPTCPAGGRRWVIDGLDGTANFVLGVPHWCSAVALEDADGPAVAAVYDPLRDELFSAGRGARLRPQRRRAAGARGPARRSTRGDRDVLPARHLRPRRRAAGARPRRPRLRVAAHHGLGRDRARLGRRRAPRRLGRSRARSRGTGSPGSLLVREAGGACREGVGAAGWALAGPAALVEALAGVLEARVTDCRLGVLAFGDSITNGGGELQWGVALQSWALWVARALGLPYTPVRGRRRDGARRRRRADPRLAGAVGRPLRHRLPVHRRQRRARLATGTPTRTPPTCDRACAALRDALRPRAVPDDPARPRAPARGGEGGGGQRGDRGGGARRRARWSSTCATSAPATT